MADASRKTSRGSPSGRIAAGAEPTLQRRIQRDGVEGLTPWPPLHVAERGNLSEAQRTRIPSFASQCNGLAALASGLSGTSPTETPYFQSGGQMAMKRA